MEQVNDKILDSFAAVAAERRRRTLDNVLAAQVNEVKRYQRSRFEDTYADLLADSRYVAAAKFFLDELYGPGDFARRDEQVIKVVPTLKRLFPAEVVHIVGALASLHALSESLDTDMAERLQQLEINEASYANAWLAVA